MSLKARVLALVLALALAKLDPLVEPRAFNYSSEPEHLSLAVTEKLTIPLLGSISSRIQYVPENAGECTTSETRARYKEVASRTLDRSSDTLVTSILTLQSHQLAFTIDQYFYLSVYSLNNSNMLKEPVNSRKIFQQNSTQFGSNPKLIATPNESVVYILSSIGYSFFNVESLSTEIKLSNQNPLSGELFAAVIFKDYMYVASGEKGITIYHLEENHDLKLVKSLTDLYCIDLKIDTEKQVLYALDIFRGIHVYNLTDPSKPVSHDFLDLQKLTSASNSKIEVKGDTILVLFYRNRKNVIAEFNYKLTQTSLTFLRYFKFTAAITEMHILQNYFMVLGNEFLAIMPTGIHPKLIKEELNGLITLSPIKTGVVYQEPFFVGVTEHSIVLGAIHISQYETIECKLDATSKLQKITYQANLTSCSSQEVSREYFDFCQYEKQFFIKQMDIVAPASIAYLVWGVLGVLCAALLGGCLFLVIMRTRKLKKIRKMEMEFEQKLQNIALPSARMTDRIGGDVRT